MPIIDFLKKRRVARERGPARSLFEARKSFAPVGQLLPIPDDITITLSTWRWLTSTVGVDPASVCLAGDSVEGALTLALMHALRDAREPLLAAAVLISPLLDLTA